MFEFNFVIDVFLIFFIIKNSYMCKQYKKNKNQFLLQEKGKPKETPEEKNIIDTKFKSDFGFEILDMTSSIDKNFRNVVKTR